ncbi:MAG TPA: glycosyltransferase family 39 protein [Ktedonobacteraceae bacterium]|nr:glycosyltransferase family 39 protein [Ktedonobacteraceae bacterium]
MTQTSGKLGQAEEDNLALERHEKKSVLQRLRGGMLLLSRRRTFQVYAVSVVLFLIALGFDLYHLGAPSIWFDEAFSVELARQPLPLIWHIIWGPEPNMELYYLLLHFWLGFTGWLGVLPTEFVVRFPSTIFAALSTVIVYLLGRRFLGTTAGIVAAVLYLLNDLQLVYAQQTRAYSLQLLMICLAWYALFVVLFQQAGAKDVDLSGGSAERPRPGRDKSGPYPPKGQRAHAKRWWACFILATTLAVYTHLFSMLVLLAQLLAFGGLLIVPGPWRDRARQQLRPMLLSLLSIGILIVPMLLESLHGPKTGWLPIPHLHDLSNLFLTIYGASKFYLLIMFLCCALGLFVAILPHLSGNRALLSIIIPEKGLAEAEQARFRQWLPVAFGLVCWIVVPVIVSYIVSQGSTRLFSSRYLVVIVPPLCLLAGLGVGALRWRSTKILVALVVMLVALYYVPVYYRSAQVEDWNTAVPWLEQHYAAGDGLVCYDSDVQQGCQIAVEYYLHAYPSPAHFTSDSPGAFSWQNFGPADPHSSSEAATDPQALSAYGAKHPRIFFIVGRIPDSAAAARAQAAQQWLDSHYRLVNRIVTPTVTISLYATGVG